MKRTRPLARLFALAAALAACRPDLGDRESLVLGTRVLAVRAEPPEAKPGASVTYRVLVVGPDGTSATPLIDWAFCASPKPLAENDVVSRECATGGVRAIAAAASATITATTPDDACALFGPDPPPGGFRPRDPDGTGGFYQPVRAITSGGAMTFALERIVCNLANASIDAAQDFAKRYTPNKNPTLLPLGDPGRVSPGQRVRFVVGWAPADAESYVALDVGSQAVVDRREAMRVSWFATAGAWATDHTGQSESEALATTENTWTAPESAGVVHVWVVLRDSRGGVDFGAIDVTVAR